VRILTYTSLFPNSEQPNHGIFVYQRIAHLARRSGNEVEVIAPIPYSPKWAPGENRRAFAEIPSREQIGELPVEHPRYPLIPKISMTLHALSMALGSESTARRLHEKHSFECIDAHFVYPDGTAAVLLGKLLRLPVVVTARGTDATLYPNFRLIRRILQWTYRQSAGIVAVSESLKQAILELGIPRERVRTIANGIDAERFSPSDQGEAKQRLGIPEDVPVVVSVGNLNEVKSQHLLVSAVQLLSPRFPTLRLYLIGEGPQRGRLQEQIESSNLQSRVSLVGGVRNENLRTWYSAADMSCLVSSREGWPNVVTESLACGTPVVAAQVGGIHEIITSPELGMFVEREPNSIATGIETALGKPWNRMKISQQARERTWDLVAAETEGYLRECVGRAAPSEGADRGVDTERVHTP
jgi:teichuronic acid biosynthesis glycosyltransferase TuaC